ncbi:MAG: hypothetical protein ABDH49_06325 [Candidatus Hydrothermales bacterium]
MEVALGSLGVGFTLLAFAIGYMAWRNGKIIRENTMAIIKSMDEGFRRIDEGFRKMDEGFKRMDEGFRKTWEKMDDSFRLIALFILAETKEEKKELAKRILGEKG